MVKSTSFQPQPRMSPEEMQSHETPRNTRVFKNKLLLKALRQDAAADGTVLLKVPVPKHVVQQAVDDKNDLLVTVKAVAPLAGPQVLLPLAESPLAASATSAISTGVCGGHASGMLNANSPSSTQSQDRVFEPLNLEEEERIISEQMSDLDMLLRHTESVPEEDSTFTPPQPAPSTPQEVGIDERHPVDLAFPSNGSVSIMDRTPARAVASIKSEPHAPAPAAPKRQLDHVEHADDRSSDAQVADKRRSNSPAPKRACKEGEAKYVMKRVTAYRRRKHNNSVIMEWKVQWEGYPASQATWEPEDQVSGELVYKFFEATIQTLCRTMPELSYLLGTAVHVTDAQLLAAKEDDDDQEYTISRLLKEGITSTGQVAYRTAWEGYPESEATWKLLTELDSASVTDFHLAELQRIRGRLQEMSRAVTNCLH